jgi:hypothetical protein
MIHRHIEDLASRVRRSRKLSPQQKETLLAQLAYLRTEAANLPRRKEDDSSITSVDDDGPLSPLVRELADSIERLESSHPRLTELTNQVALTLANMGI